MGFGVSWYQGKMPFLTSEAKMTPANELCTSKYVKIDPHDNLSENLVNGPDRSLWEWSGRTKMVQSEFLC